jgi:hypothetical protein
MIKSTVVMGCSVHGRVAHFLPAWSKSTTIAIAPTNIISLSGTNTIGYYPWCEDDRPERWGWSYCGAQGAKRGMDWKKLWLNMDSGELREQDLQQSSQ